MLTILLPSLLIAYGLSELFGAMSDNDDASEQDETASTSDENIQTITAVLGEDGGVFNGGPGSDTFSGGPGNDELFGNEGDDLIFGEAGDDTAYGGAGDDRVFLGDGNDTAPGSATASAGDDLIRGGNGNDDITDQYGADTLYGDLGADRLDAVDAAGTVVAGDTLIGGLGDDTLIGDAADTMTGGDGDDLFMVTQTDVTDSAAMITDYEDGEMVCIVVPEANPSDTLITRASANGADTEIVFRGEVMAVVQGISNPANVTTQLAPNVFFG